MATVPVLVFLGDSNMSGLADLTDVPAADFLRWAGDSWSTQTWPTGGPFGDWPKDEDIPDVQMLTVNMPYTAADERNITAVPAANQITVDGANLVAAQQDSWVYLSSNSTGYGQHLRINADPSGDTTMTLIDPLTLGNPLVAVTNDGKLKLLTASHTVASSTTDSDNDTTTITKTGLTDNFTVGVDDWVVIIGTSAGSINAWKLGRRVVSATATTVTVSPALGTLPVAGDGIREMTASGTVRKLSELTSTNCAFRALRFYHDGATSYSAPGDFPTMLSLPSVCPAVHTTDDNVNGVAEATWAIKSHFDGSIYCIMEGVGGSTAASGNVDDDFLNNNKRYSYAVDIDHNDFRPGSPNGLFDILTAKLDAAKTLLTAAGHTMDVVGVLSNVGTNDAALEARADQFAESMAFIVDTLRNYIVSNTMTTRTADRIPFGLTAVNATIAVRPFKETVNTAMQAIAASKPSVFYVDSSAFTLEADDLHLDAAGQIAWAKAFYTGWLALYDDHTALTVETGTGSSTANSYCTVDHADDFHRQRNNNQTAWSGATTATKQAALRYATMSLDLRYGTRWAGERGTSDQALDWPRKYAYDSADNRIASDSMPVRLKDATAMLALMHVQGETILPSTETSADISSETKSVGAVSKSVTYLGGKPSQTKFPALDRMLWSANLIESAGIGWGAAGS